MVSSLAYLVTMLRKDFTNFCNQELQELGLSQGLLFFLIYIGKHPECSPGAVAEALHMDTGHVTRSLVKLEQDNFIAQSVNPADRRAHTLRLMDKGENAFRISHELFTRWDDVVIGEMPASDRACLMALLGGLAHGKEGKGCARLSTGGVQQHTGVHCIYDKGD